MKITREEILEGIKDIILPKDIDVEGLVELGQRAVDQGMISDDKESVLSFIRMGL